jgi:two-component system sensor histidine kinase KdpD
VHGSMKYLPDTVEAASLRLLDGGLFRLSLTRPCDRTIMVQGLTDRRYLARIQPAGSFRALGECLAVCSGLAVLTYGGILLRVNLTTISFLNLLLVLIVALFCGFWQASLTSLLAVACLDYFFLPPLFRFNIADSQDWVSLGAFEFTAIVVSRLSARELRNAKEAAINRKGMEQLYELSRSSLLLDLSQAPGPQLIALIQRIFETSAVALYDDGLKRIDKIGDWNLAEESLAKECYLRDSSQDDTQTRTSQRILRASHGSVGALVVRGKLNLLVLDALAALAAMAMDRHQSFENEDKAEKAKQSEQLRTAVLDALAHEFKTPLTAIQTASAGLLELGGLGDSQGDLAMLIEHEAVRLEELCTRLLRTAKLEAREAGLQISDVNVQQLILEVLAGPTAKEASDRIKVTLDNPMLTVRGDRGLLSMILTQYIDNARKYSTPGTKIEILAQEDPTGLLISVHNIGFTIRIEDRERIFERFYRSPDSEESVSGTGIGLSVARKAAEAHHGHVWVISDEKEGTTFFLSIPNGARRNLR